jgi:hypothetical protein
VVRRPLIAILVGVVVAVVLLATVLIRSNASRSPALSSGASAAASPAVATAPASAPAVPQPPVKEGPLYQFSEADVDRYLRRLQHDEPDLRRRVVQIARRNIGQPYELYLLGEAPFEMIDAQPVYCLGKSDCVVFVEHTLAMALSDSWPGFLAMLQRIRYDGGAIGVLTRNHYTEADWNRHNAWLVRDVTDELGGSGVVRFRQGVNRAKFFKDRYDLDTSIPAQTIDESFIPYEQVGSIKHLLKDGDVVNFVRGVGDNYWVGHVGLVALGPDGDVHLIHSTPPVVREEPIEAYVRRNTTAAFERDDATKARFRGFKFLRINEDALARLRAIDGPDAPRVTVPAGSGVTWAQFLASFKSD